MENTIRKCSYEPQRDLITVDYGDRENSDELYLEVKFREHWFQVYCAENAISGYIDAGDLTVDSIGDNTCIVKSTAKIIMNGENAASVTAARFIPLGDTDQIQSAVTMAIGRALAAAGFSTVSASRHECGAPYPVDSGIKLVRDDRNTGIFRRTSAEKADSSRKAEPVNTAEANAAVRENPMLRQREKPSNAVRECADSVPHTPLTLQEAYSFVIPIGSENQCKGKTISEAMGTNPGIVSWYASDSFNPERGSQENRALRSRLKEACILVSKAAQ